MLKKVYIIEAKLSLEKNRQLTEYLESEKEYEKIESYAHADYIITELKSPSRIMRNVRKVKQSKVPLCFSLVYSVQYLVYMPGCSYSMVTGKVHQKACTYPLLKLSLF